MVCEVKFSTKTSASRTRLSSIDRPSGALEIEGDAQLVSVDPIEQRRAFKDQSVVPDRDPAPPVEAPDGLHLDDFCAEVGEHGAYQRSGPPLSDLDHPESAERTRGVLPHQRRPSPRCGAISIARSPLGTRGVLLHQTRPPARRRAISSAGTPSRAPRTSRLALPRAGAGSLRHPPSPNRMGGPGNGTPSSGPPARGWK